MASIPDIKIRRVTEHRAEYGSCPMCRRPVASDDRRIRIGDGLWVHHECGTYSSRRREERREGLPSRDRGRALRRARRLVDGARGALGGLRDRE